MSDVTPGALGALALLHHPVRLALYRHVASRAGWVDRDEAARSAGTSRPLAAYHLDRLLAGGLLEVAYRRPEGRGGPGAGRPAKVYRRLQQAVQVSLPPRRYDLAAELLVSAIDEAPEDGERDRLAATAHAFGMRLGTAARDAIGPRPSARRLRDGLSAELRTIGFEPREAGHSITLGNCPFEMLSRTHREAVCGMNLALVTGLVEGAGIAGARTRLDPKEGRCCVVVTTDRLRSAVR